jgi:hypothetical protein
LRNWKKVYTFGDTFLKMKNLSLKLNDATFQETEELVDLLKKNRNAYINEALRYYNLLQKRRLLARELAKEADLANLTDPEIVVEMDALEDPIP